MPTQRVRDVDIYYEEVGLGDTVLFLHSGYSRGILAFGGQIQPFSQGWRCLYPDFRGHGRTRGGYHAWDTAVLAEDMLGFMDAMAIDRAHLIGYSLGGGVALHMAARAPGRVRSITTIGCGGVADPTGVEAYTPEAIEQAGNTALIQRMLALHGEANGGDWRRFMHNSAEDWRKYPAISDDDWARLTMPMLIIGGEHDTFATPQRLAAMQGRCPQAEAYIVQGGGHRPHMPMEQIQQVNARMLAFLEGITA